MIIYIDANGEVLEQEYTEVVQGDNDANSIYLIAPLAQNAVVTMSFECPNGYVTDPNSDIYKMTPSIDNMVGGLRMWKLSIKNIPITQYYGIVKYQIKATINGKTIAVARGKFKVQEGVDWQLPSTPDVNVYADILYALNEVEANLINKVNINYNGKDPVYDTDVEQQIINNENGLKIVKTAFGKTAVFEFANNGIYHIKDIDGTKKWIKLVDAEELEAVKAEIELDLEAVKAELSTEIGKVANELIEFKATAENQFELIDNTKGTKIVASVDNQTYVMNFELQNSKGTTISTSQIDLPLESVVVNGTYADGILTLTLKNGNTVDVDIRDIVRGLATEEYVNELVGNVRSDAYLFTQQHAYSKSVTDGLLASTLDEAFDGIDSSIGRQYIVDFDAVLEGDTIVANLHETISDFELRNNTAYQFHIYLPLVTLTGDLSDTYRIVLRDRNGNDINLNCITQKDFTETATVGDLCQIQDYDIGIGYSWEFNGYYREITDNGVEYKVVYIDTIVRETNPSMTGEQIVRAISDNKLKGGTTVLCTTDYISNGYEYKKGHSYLVNSEYLGGEIMLSTTDLTPSAENKLESETMSILALADSWVAEDNDPFAYKAVIQTTIQGVEGVSSSQISSDAIYELINNNPINFAKYGFALNDVYRELDESGNETFMLEFLAVEKPTQQMLFQIVITGTQVDIGGAV